MAFTTNNLVSYRDEHAMDLIAKLNWAGDSLKFFEKIRATTNIVTLNYFEVDPVLKFGTFCSSMSASGNTNLYQKDIFGFQSPLSQNRFHYQNRIKNIRCFLK